MSTVINLMNNLKWVFSDKRIDYEEASYNMPASYNQSRFITRQFSKTSLTSSIFHRIAMDVASLEWRHVQLDKSTGAKTDVESNLAIALGIEANIDQSTLDFIHDLTFSVLDQSVVAVIPVDYFATGEVITDIFTLRVAEILVWYPEHIRVKAYNALTGMFEELVVPKRTTAIIENPMFNDTSPTLKRLIRKLQLLDKQELDRSKNKWNLIMQLPYEVKSDVKKAKVEARMKSLEDQLNKSDYGIAYMDATEKVTQLNRTIDNSLQDEIQYLEAKINSELGQVEKIVNGTASEEELNQYFERFIELFADRIAAEFTRKFLGRDRAIAGERIAYYRDPFKVASIEKKSNLLDKLITNRIATTNEVRIKLLGWDPSDDESADKLNNPNVDTLESIGQQAAGTGLGTDPEVAQPSSK